MKIKLFLVLLVLGSTFITLTMDDHQAHYSVQEQKPFTMKPVDRNWELAEAIRHGISSFAAFIGLCYCTKMASAFFKTKDVETGNQFVVGINFVIGLHLLDLAYKKGVLCTEALKKAFSGYTLTDTPTGLQRSLLVARRTRRTLIIG
jgi:hypothetical protein